MLEQRVKEWTRPWWEEGRRKGLEEGRQEGQQLGEAKVLASLLEHRFGPLPPRLRTRIAEAQEEQVLRWARRLLTAANLEEVFDEAADTAGR